jgi:hypothetical protein
MQLQWEPVAQLQQMGLPLLFQQSLSLAVEAVETVEALAVTEALVVVREVEMALLVQELEELVASDLTEEAEHSHLLVVVVEVLDKMEVPQALITQMVELAVMVLHLRSQGLL